MVGGTQIGAPFASFQQNATVTPPGSVESWPSYQTPYEISSHFSLLSPAASPYGSFSQYGTTYVHENQLYPVRQHYNYGSPPRVSNGEIDDKTEHYTTAMDDKYENPCNETYVYHMCVCILVNIKLTARIAKITQKKTCRKKVCWSTYQI